MREVGFTVRRRSQIDSGVIRRIAATTRSGIEESPCFAGFLCDGNSLDHDVHDQGHQRLDHSQPITLEIIDMFRNCLIALVVFALALSLERSARANHDHPLERVSREYREAVKDFERCIRRIRGFDRSDERLADDLEDASGRFRSAANRLDRPERLHKAWSEVTFYHHEAGNHFIANPYRGREAAALLAVWNRADYLYAQLAEQMRGLSTQFFGVGSCGVRRPLISAHAHGGAFYGGPTYRVPASVQRAYRESDLRTRQHSFEPRSIGGVQVGANLSGRFN